MEKEIIQSLDSLHDIQRSVRDLKIKTNFDRAMQNNQEWAANKVKQDPQYFKKLVAIQQPQYLWIGCSDSRVPPNQIVGLKPGQLFVHRNIANIVSTSDINFLAVLQYSVQVLKVKDIIVCGHYGCGGCKAAFSKFDFGPLEAWLFNIRDTRSKYRKLMNGTQQQNQNILVEVNVKQGVYNVAKTPVVQQAWKKKQDLRIHGLVYQMEDGLLKDLGITLSKLTQLKEQYRIVEP